MIEAGSAEAGVTPTEIVTAPSSRAGPLVDSSSVGGDSSIGGDTGPGAAATETTKVAASDVARSPSFSCATALAGGVSRVRIGDLAALTVPDAGTAIVARVDATDAVFSR